jgi:hypothetical protein
MGSGLPQFGFPRRFAIDLLSLMKSDLDRTSSATGWGPVTREVTLESYFTDLFFKNQ